MPDRFLAVDPVDSYFLLSSDYVSPTDKNLFSHFGSGSVRDIRLLILAVE